MYEKQGRGVIGELIVHSDLIKKGYDVLTQDTGQGLIDLVAVHPTTGEVRFFEVKCVSRRADGTRINRVLKHNQKNWEKVSGKIIELVYVDIDTYEVIYPQRRRKVS